MTNNKHNKQIYYISRPASTLIDGTGEEIMAVYILNTLAEKKLSFLQTKKLMGFPPYHSFMSIIAYDYLSPFLFFIQALFRRPQLIFFHTQFQAFFLPLFRLLGIPCVVQILDLFFLDIKPKSYFDYYAKVHYWITCKFATHITTISDETKVRIRNSTKANLKVIYPGVPSNITYFKRKKPFNNIGYIGSYNKRKRVNLIVDLVNTLGQQNNKYNFYLAGQITLEFENLFKEACRPFKKIKYKILGKIPENEKNGFYTSIDILFYPTKLEGFGIPIIEAKFSGAIPIVFEDAAIPKVTKDLAIQLKSVKDFNPNGINSNLIVHTDYKLFQYLEFYKFISSIIKKC
jgi:glycosyltransferase involved in cell wall biosynthesis